MSVLAVIAVTGIILTVLSAAGLIWLAYGADTCRQMPAGPPAPDDGLDLPDWCPGEGGRD